MTPDDQTLAELAERAEELAREHDVLRIRRAELGDYSAQVHEEAARVHEELGARSLLDPSALRAHAADDRAMAAQERAALRRDPAGIPPDDAAG